MGRQTARSCYSQSTIWVIWILACCLASPAPLLLAGEPAQSAAPLALEWKQNILTITGQHIPGRQLQVLYLEAYCRADAHEADWVAHTVIGHRTELVSLSADGRQLKLRCQLQDGVTVDHTIEAGSDEVDFHLVAHNPTDQRSEAVWAQPCIRVGDFTGLGVPGTAQSYQYLRKSFVFLDGELTLMPTPVWATEARYTPGQVWRAPHVPPRDVNPRPLNPQVPSHGLIGCFSRDNTLIMATAWEPWHELFQGVITCLHSDFHIGGLEPNETKQIRGKIYIMTNDVDQLLARYQRDFSGKR